MMLIFCNKPELKASYEEILSDFSPTVTTDIAVFTKAAPDADLIIWDGPLETLSSLDTSAIVVWIGDKDPEKEDVLFLSKPLSSSVLWARVDMLWRRIQKGLLVNFSTPNYTFCGATRTLNGIPLTQKEAELIEYLTENKDRVVSRDELLSSIFGYKEGVETHTLETHIYKLRQKIGDKDEALIQTRDGGYCLNLK